MKTKYMWKYCPFLHASMWKFVENFQKLNAFFHIKNAYFKTSLDFVGIQPPACDLAWFHCTAHDQISITCDKTEKKAFVEMLSPEGAFSRGCLASKTFGWRLHPVQIPYA